MLDKYAQMLASAGRGGDTMAAHLTPGEVVIPRSAQSPDVMNVVLQAMKAQGLDPHRYIVGGQGDSINPMTGAAEYMDQEGGDFQSGNETPSTSQESSYGGAENGSGGDQTSPGGSRIGGTGPDGTPYYYENDGKNSERQWWGMNKGIADESQMPTWLRMENDWRAAQSAPKPAAAPSPPPPPPPSVTTPSAPPPEVPGATATPTAAPAPTYDNKARAASRTSQWHGYTEGDDDDIIRTILGEQRGNAQTLLDRNKARGKLNDQGYNAALGKLDQQNSTAWSKANTLGRSVIDRYQADLDKIKTGASAAGAAAPSTEEFDFSPFDAQQTALRNRFMSSLTGDIRGVLPTDMFDIGELINAGGSAQGAQNPRSLVDSLSGRRNRPVQTRGLGSQGVF